MLTRVCSRLGVAVLVVATACTSEPPPLPGSGDSGFDLERDAFRFENFGTGYDAAQIDTALAVRMFGAENVCVPGSNPCQATADATAWMAMANDTMATGHCEGLAVLSQLFYLKVLDPNDFGAPTVRALELEENYKLQRELAYWFATQLVPGATDNRALSPRAAVSLMADFMKPGATDFYRIGMVQKDSSGYGDAHSLTPIGFARGETENVYEVRVYDNNAPGYEGVIRLDVARNTWEFHGVAASGPVVYTGGDAEKNPLWFAPTRSRTAKLACPFCKNDATRTVTVSGASPLVTDAQGRETGIKNGEIVEGAGSVAPGFSICGTAGATVTVTAAVTADAPITVALAPSHGEKTKLNVSGGSFGTLSVEGDLATASTGQVQVSGSQVSIQPGGSGTVSASFNAGGVTVKVSVSGSTPGSSVSVSRDPSTGKVTVSAGNSPGAKVDVELSTAGSKTSYSADASSGGDTSIAIDAGGWSGGTPPPATVTTDGTSTPTSGSTCATRAKDGVETDVDCGGANACARCRNDAACLVDTDCASGTCGPAKTCVTKCYDGVKNVSETDTDCGGDQCKACASGKTCKADSDCVQGGCVAGTCIEPTTIRGTTSGLGTGRSATLTITAPVQGEATRSATFKVQEGTFSSVWAAGKLFVGGAYSIEVSRQPDDRLCTVTTGATGTITASPSANRDVAGVVVTCVPYAQPCANGVKDGQETDVDCGGADCSPSGKACAVGKACVVDRDCAVPGASAICSNGACRTTYAIGGAAQVTVPVTLVLTPSGTLTDSTASRTTTVLPSHRSWSFDNTRVTSSWSLATQPQTGVSCSFTTSGFVSSDNRSVTDLYCSSCGNGTKEGRETDVDCGGDDCNAESKRCGGGQRCLADADCASLSCNATTKTCAGSCTDGVKNGSETDVDCGGSCATEGRLCGGGKSCSVGGDCASGTCAANGQCTVPTGWSSVAATTFGATTTTHDAAVALAANDIFATGGDTLGRYDGAAWTTQQPFGAGTTIQAMFARLNSFNLANVWVAGADNIFKYWNGNAWFTPTSDAGATTSWRSLHGAANSLFAVGSGGAIAKWNGTNFSTGGNTFPPPIPCTSYDLNGVFVVDDNTAWAVGNQGTVCAYSGGAWTAKSSGTTANLRAVWASSANDAWAVGDGGVAIHWTGASWSSVSTSTTQDLRGVYGRSASAVWFVGAAGTVRTWNGATIAGEASNTTKDLRTVFGFDVNVWAMGANNAFIGRN